MEKRIVIALLTIAAFLLCQKAGEFFKLFDWFTNLDSLYRGIVLKTAGYIALPLGFMLLFHGSGSVLKESGLSPEKFKSGIGTGFLGTLPMLLGAGLLVNFNMTIHFQAILLGCLLAALGEEILYRGLLFGQLFRHAGWGFVAAGLASAVIFGIGHLYQGENLASTIGVFLVTFLGGMWFSWLYVENGYNLWVPISYHFFMNLSWQIFDVSDTALGGIGPNIFRAMTIALSIWLTIRFKKQTNSSWQISGRRWWTGKGADAAAVQE